MAMPEGDAPLVPGLTVLVPVYFSEAGLEALVTRLAEELPKLGRAFELLLVNDGSRDGSQAQIERLATGRPWLRWIELRRNFGQHNAILCGLRAARYDVVATLDDDLQHPPEELPKLLERLTPDVDVVYGAPERERHGLFRDLASQLTKWALQTSMGVQAARDVSAFRVLRTDLRDGFASYEGPSVSLDVLLTWSTNRFTSVRVRHDERRVGTSNYTFGKLVRIAVELITGFSDRPLRLASILGIAFACLGALLLVYQVGVYVVRGGAVPGFTFLASSVTLFSGVQLVALGIIGEYLGRVHMRAMRRPTYVVRRRGGGPAPEDAR